MIDPLLLERANDVLVRLYALDEAVANARAFRALLENLHSRNLGVIKEPHVTTIYIARAGVLRAMIGTVMACLDPDDWRGNRASVGQILRMLEDPKLVSCFPEPGSSAPQCSVALQRARQEYQALTQSDLFKHQKQIRNETVAHLLISKKDTPILQYDDIYELHDVAERLTADLYRACDRGQPRFVEHEASLVKHAQLFWDTYFSGVSAASHQT
ncbi:hypothetical protein QA639_21800 [Bradyrhizobium pachyrhizi]|uniref:hypothetical protein n=1 Tax=Bradyrhizobium pachyrhizi TaxID=280333 RepID=UPI0024B26996|nr:hypothetical protein [Bradyrhizobium pachyrhizi]WFU52344.1 hypothetical protein QA639_21800 [Bradyrhizobium pachyrhizi]